MWKLDRVLFWVLNIGICFEFRASRFGFLKKYGEQNIMGIQLVTSQNDRALGFEFGLGLLIGVGTEK